MDLPAFSVVFIILIVFQINPNHTYGQRFTSNSNNYYIDVEKKYSWFDSLITCMEMNMTLITIDSRTKSNEINTLVENNFGIVPLWIGGIMSRFPSRHFIWLATGKAFSYTNWSGTNPDFYGNDEYCVQIGWGYNLQWNDNTCTNAQGFICEDNPSHRNSKQLQQELQAEKKTQLELLQRLTQKAKIQLELRKQIQEKQAQKDELQQELEKVKETIEQESQKYLQYQSSLNQEIEKLRDNLKQDADKFENIEHNLKDALETQEKLQKELKEQQNSKDQFKEELEICKENLQTISTEKNKKYRDIILHFHQNQ